MSDGRSNLADSSTSFSVVTESDKYILFGLAGETYGLSLLQINEILSSCELTMLPNLPDYFQGVTSVRGEPIPVINLRRRFGFEDIKNDKQSRVIIVDLDSSLVGITVDEVFRVTTIRSSDIEAPPDFAEGRKSQLVVGVSERENGKLVIHLDMQKILSDSENFNFAEFSSSLK